MGLYRLTLIVSYDEQKKLFKEKMSHLIVVFCGSHVSGKVILPNFLSFNLLSFASYMSFYFSNKETLPNSDHCLLILFHHHFLLFDYLHFYNKLTTQALPKSKVMNVNNQNTTVNEKHATQETSNFK